MRTRGSYYCRCTIGSSCSVGSTIIAKGASNREIAEALYITEKTVKNNITRILDRLNLRDRTQAAIMANSILHNI